MNGGGEITIAGLRVSAPSTWMFAEFENLVLARRESRGGVLQLSTAFRYDCTDSQTPARCEDCAREWLTDALVGAFDTHPLGRSEGRIGVADLDPSGTEGQAWYVLRDGQLLLGSFRWAPDRQHDPQCKDELEEAEAILLSAEWDAGSQVVERAEATASGAPRRTESKLGHVSSTGLSFGSQNERRRLHRMELPTEITEFIREYHKDGVEPADCRECASGCCSEGGFAILENVLAIYDLYLAGKLKRKGMKFAKHLALIDFVFAYFDVWERPVDSQEDQEALMFFHMKSIDEKGRPISIPGESYWTVRRELFGLNPWLNHGCVFLSHRVPSWPRNDGMSKRHCVLHRPDSATHLGPKPIDCVFFTCREPFDPKVPEEELTGKWFEMLARHFPNSKERWDEIYKEGA